MDLEEKKKLITTWFMTLQTQLIERLEAIDASASNSLYNDTPGHFVRRPWERDGGGGGTMAILQGRVFEKAGVNFSCVHGEFCEEFRHLIPGASKNPAFWASGISVVIHPKSPLVPIAHMNTRFIITEKAWFGGGADLTPCFPMQQDTFDFHGAFKEVCEQYQPGTYSQFKKAADDYYYIPHRKEHRGVGGIFYDYLDSGDWQADFVFNQAVGTAFAKIYPEIVMRHMNKAWSSDDYRIQLKKRSRYVEFNLVYDRGTQFGFKTNGHTEAILMSLPPLAAWTMD